MQMKGYAGNKSFIKPSDIQVRDSVMSDRTQARRPRLPMRQKHCRCCTGKAPGWQQSGPAAAPSPGPQLTLRKFPFRSSEEAHKWSSAECPAEPVSESPPSTREDEPPSLEHTDGTTVGVGANEFIRADLALPVGLTAPLALDQGPRRSETHRKYADTYLKEKYPDSQL